MDQEDSISVKRDDELTECQNCGHLDRGNFCSSCGQRFTELNRPLKDILSELGDIVNVDSRIFRSILPFLFSPGYLTREYLAGKRRRYMSPFRLYLLLSLLFFFLAQSTSKKIAEADDDWVRITSDTSDTVIMDDSLAIELLRTDSLFLTDVDTSSAKFLRKAKRRERLREGAIDALLNKNIFLTNFYKTISYVLFILMPVFALLLNFLYIRRRVFYIEHLMFSINMHSFMLLVFSLMIILSQVIKENSQHVAWMFILVPVYFTTGMKRFYRQPLWKILLKEILLAGIYFIILLLSLLVAGYITLYFF